MIGEYAEILERLERVARGLGFSPALNQDFLAKFSRADGWQIVLEGDRVAYPAFTLSVARVFRNELPRSYALWLLMRHFDDLIDPDHQRPSAANQMWFLESFSDKIFNHEESYRAAYIQLEMS